MKHDNNGERVMVGIKRTVIVEDYGPMTTTTWRGDGCKLGLVWKNRRIEQDQRNKQRLETFKAKVHLGLLNR